jgi:WD40 repeat protein
MPQISVDVQKRLLSAPPASMPHKLVTEPALQIKQAQLESSDSHAASVSALAVDPAGLIALSGGKDRQLMLWHLPTLEKIRSWYDFAGEIRSLDISPDGRRFVLLEGHRDLAIWSMRGHQITRIVSDSDLVEVKFAPLANQLLAITRSGEILSYHGAKLNLIHKQQACTQGISSLRLSIDPQQRWIAVSCGDGQVWLRKWSDQKGIVVKNAQPVTALAFAPHVPLLLMGTSEADLQLWDITQPKEELQLKLLHQRQGHIRGILQVRFSKQGNLLATSGLDRSIAIWSIEHNQLKLERLLPQETTATTLAFIVAEHPRILSGHDCGKLRVFLPKGEIAAQRSPPPILGRTISFSPKEDLLISDAEIGSTAIWNLQTGQRELSLAIQPKSLLYVAFAIDGTHLLSVDPYNAVFWDLRTRRAIANVAPPPRAQITAAALGKDWTQVWFGTAQHGVHYWTIAGSRRLYRHHDPKCVTSVALHPLTQRAAAATCKGELYIYDLQTYRLIKKIKASPHPILKLEFDPNGQRMLLLTELEAALWSLPALEKKHYITHTHVLLSGTFSPDNKMIAIGSADRVVYLWNLEQNQLQLAYSGCRAPVRNIQFSPRSDLLAASCYDGQIQLWHRTSRRKIISLIAMPQKEWLSITPTNYFFSSQAALKHFFFHIDQQKIWLGDLQTKYFSPRLLRKILQAPGSAHKVPTQIR